MSWVLGLSFPPVTICSLCSPGLGQGLLASGTSEEIPEGCPQQGDADPHRALPSGDACPLPSAALGRAQTLGHRDAPLQGWPSWGQSTSSLGTPPEARALGPGGPCPSCGLNAENQPSGPLFCSPSPSMNPSSLLGPTAHSPGPVCGGPVGKFLTKRCQTNLCQVELLHHILRVGGGVGRPVHRWINRAPEGGVVPPTKLRGELGLLCPATPRFTEV